MTECCNIDLSSVATPAEMDKAKNAYERILSKSIDNHSVNWMRCTTKLFSLAGAIYFIMNDSIYDSTAKIFIAGSLADSFDETIDYLKSKYNLDDDTLAEKLEKTSRLYKDNDFNVTIPEFDNSEGYHVVKTAKGMMYDMKRIYDSCHSLRKAMKEGVKDAPVSLPKCRDDKDIGLRTDRTQTILDPLEGVC